MKPCIRYSDGWKYRLEERLAVQTAITGYDCVTAWIELLPDGTLILAPGYCWDGPSGPAFDTPSFMRPSAAHDALHQLMRLGLLPQSMRGPADAEMRRLCEQDGMWAPRRWWCWVGVRLGAASAADPASLAPIRCAPGNCGRCP